VSGLPTPRTPEGQAALGVVAAEPNRTVVALDYDGTLAPIVDRPEDAVAHPGAAAALGALAAVGQVAIVTGRPSAEAVRLGRLAGIPGLIVAALREMDVGSVVVCSDSAESPPRLREQADLVVAGPAGVVSFLRALTKVIVS
jgi:Trehalose-phosphatase